MRPTTSHKERFCKLARHRGDSNFLRSGVTDVDCSEYPCIVFGRLVGAEDVMERVEHTRAVAAYRDDVRTVLFWMASTEEGEHEAGHDEIGLFAVAYYTAEDRDRLGDALDRRIRSRTADLWNTTTPERRQQHGI